MFLRDSLAMRSLKVNQERDALMHELSLIDEAIRPLQGEIENCKEQANLTSSRISFGFFATIGLQFALSQYGTYVMFSWDIIEPITACVSLTDAIAAYFFWLWAGRPWDIRALRQFFFERKWKKLMKKQNINYSKFEELTKAREEVLRKLHI